MKDSLLNRRLTHRFPLTRMSQSNFLTAGNFYFIKRAFVVLFLLFFSRLTMALDIGFQFLNRRQSPRNEAVAGANISDYNDVSSIFMHPAGLGSIDNYQFTIAYTDYLLDARGGMAAGALPFGKWDNLGLGLIYFDYGNFEKIDKYAFKSGQEFGAQDAVAIFTYSQNWQREWFSAISFK